MKKELLEIISQSLSDEEVAEVLKEKTKSMIASAIEDSFRWGDAKDAIKKKVTEVMVPYIENYDFSEYLPKLDTVLTEIVNSDACMANKEILENFKDLTTVPDMEEINVSDIFKKWASQCGKDIDTYGLEVNYDDGVSYECVECHMEVEMDEERSWSSFQYATITFENDHDENLNTQIRICKYTPKYSHEEEKFKISESRDVMLSSLRHLGKFELFLIRLERAGTKIIIDKDYEEDYIYPEKEPEPSFS